MPDEEEPTSELFGDSREGESPSDAPKGDPSGEKWSFGTSKRPRLRAPKLPRISAPKFSKLRMPKFSEARTKLSEIRMPKFSEVRTKLSAIRMPKVPGLGENWASLALGVGLFVVVLLIYVGVGSLMGGGTATRRPPVARRSTAPPVSPSPSITPARACSQPSLIATVTSSRVAARKEPAASAKVVKTFGKKSVLGAPQVFLVKDQVVGPANETWYKVLLPVRPNGTFAWVPDSKVDLSQTLFRLRVVRNKFSVFFYEGCKLVKKFKVGIGAGETPTPVGKFYLQALYKLPNPNTVYGTYAYALSGYSDVITDWKFGGIIGLHGTNDPKGSIGHYVSHGCIRMRNVDVESLVPKLPLGTPIEID